MTEAVVLDAGPLGMISHPRASSEIKDWLANLLDEGTAVFVPEIADYEVRRGLLRTGTIKGLRRLDRLKLPLRFLPITTEAMLKVAEFWADARKQGRPGSHQHSLDADMILAAQAATCSNRSVVVASMNPKHLHRFIPAERWEDIEGSSR